MAVCGGGKVVEVAFPFSLPSLLMPSSHIKSLTKYL